MNKCSTAVHIPQILRQQWHIKGNLRGVFANENTP